MSWDVVVVVVVVVAYPELDRRDGCWYYRSAVRKDPVPVAGATNVAVVVVFFVVVVAETTTPVVATLPVISDPTRAMVSFDGVVVFVVVVKTERMECDFVVVVDMFGNDYRGENFPQSFHCVPRQL